MKKPEGATAGRVTIRHVAADAEVSVAAVSKVLREAYGVSDTMRTKVRLSMAKLGYRPHTAARGMRGQTFTFGLIFPDIRNPFFADLLHGIHSELEPTQYQALLGTSQSAETIEPALVDSMIDRQMDGLIIVGAIDQEQLSQISRRKPLVTIGNHDPKTREYDTVNNDDRAAGSLAVRHLIENGYRKITMLSLLAGSTIIWERESGYRDEMIRHGLGSFVNVVAGSQARPDVQTTARRLLEGPDRPDAIFCWTDFIAMQVIGAATELGLRVPEDVAIVGHDNIQDCDFGQNSLTSIDQSGELLGREAARLLISRIRGRVDAKHFVVTPRIVLRGSSRFRPSTDVVS
jgi:LacI family transcriptional regulator